jgi:hypothetical protein
MASCRIPLGKSRQRFAVVAQTFSRVCSQINRFRPAPYLLAEFLIVNF